MRGQRSPILGSGRLGLYSFPVPLCSYILDPLYRTPILCRSLGSGRLGQIPQVRGSAEVASANPPHLAVARFAGVLDHHTQTS